jgi:hypothetical protein
MSVSNYRTCTGNVLGKNILSSSLLPVCTPKVPLEWNCSRYENSRFPFPPNRVNALSSLFFHSDVEHARPIDNCQKVQFEK